MYCKFQANFLAMISIRVLQRNMDDKAQPPNFLENGGETPREQIFELNLPS